MAPANAEHGFAFIAFDCPVYPPAVLVTNLGANVRCVDRRLLAGCEPVSHYLIIPLHARLFTRYKAILVERPGSGNIAMCAAHPYTSRITDVLVLWKSRRGRLTPR